MTNYITYDVLYSKEVVTVHGYQYGPFALRQDHFHFVIDHLPSGNSLWYGPNPTLRTRYDAIRAIEKLNSFGAVWECKTIQGIALSIGMDDKSFIAKVKEVLRS